MDLVYEVPGRLLRQSGHFVVVRKPEEGGAAGEMVCPPFGVGKFEAIVAKRCPRCVVCENSSVKVLHHGVDGCERVAF
jgi:hypothetical protein